MTLDDLKSLMKGLPGQTRYLTIPCYLNWWDGRKQIALLPYCHGTFMRVREDGGIDVKVHLSDLARFINRHSRPKIDKALAGLGNPPDIPEGWVMALTGETCGVCQDHEHGRRGRHSRLLFKIEKVAGLTGKKQDRIVKWRCTECGWEYEPTRPSLSSTNKWPHSSTAVVPTHIGGDYA